MERERCGYTNKIRYATKDEARAALGAFARAKGSKRAHHGTCPFCGGYHLTKGMRGRPKKGK